MIILGIDPGTRITGFGVIKAERNRYNYVASGCIKAKSEMLSERLFEIYEGLSLVISQYTPSQVAIEKIFLNKNVDSAFKLGHARGAACVAVAQQKLNLSEYAPRVVKKSVVGYGAADKNQIQQMIKMLLGLSDTPSSDAADALAIAVCHANHVGMCG